NVSLYSYGLRVPGSPLESLDGSLDPTAAGIFSYASSGIALSPFTSYWIVLTSGTSVADGAYHWSFANNNAYGFLDGWKPMSYYASSTDGLNWLAPYYNPPLQFAVFATQIPEPGVLSLLGLSALAHLWQRHKTKAIR
ncbi:MAG TPA: choice-of-anchor R domain-containing protein, partial [Verrucomicrobiae bacterium]|nr:choice-of-anchor R domain-containing protein [Verrucomicrobiae bacterium]